MTLNVPCCIVGIGIGQVEGAGQRTRKEQAGQEGSPGIEITET